MMDNVHGINGMGGMQPARRMKAAYRMSDAPASADSVEISSEVMRLNGVEGVRMERVMAIKSQIASGDYFTPDKFDAALDRALGQLFGA